MSAPRYEVRCADFTFECGSDKHEAFSLAAAMDRSYFPGCDGPHTVWSIDPDGTETDITDESETT